MSKKLIVAGTLFGFLAVILGAFGAHALKEALDSSSLESFHTAVRYQMYHALVLIVIGGTNIWSESTKKWVFYLLVIGVILFSGSIYGLSTYEITSVNFKPIGFVTPIGGLLLILGWLILFINILKKKDFNGLKN